MFRAVVAVALCSVFACVSAASADSGTERVEYVERAESICKPRALATQRAMEGVRSDVRQGRIGVAAGKFARGTGFFESSVKLLDGLEQPPADARVLDNWLDHLGRQEEYLRGITANLRARRTVKAQRLVARFIHSGNLANDAVLAFGFNWCRFKFSRFG